MSIGYRELADLLRDGIETGQYPPGTTLPPQDRLAALHGVNIKTVRLAVGQLQAEGLVTPIRRRGTVVRERPPLRGLGSERYARRRWKFGLTEEPDGTGRVPTPGEQTQTVRLVPADPEVARALDVPVGEPVYERARLVRDGDVPTHTLTSWYRRADVEGTPLVDDSPGPAGPGGGFQVLTLQGLEPQRIRESVSAAMPSRTEREVLALQVGDPVVHLRRTTYAAGGRPVEHALGVYSATRFTWTYEFNLPD